MSEAKLTYTHECGEVFEYSPSTLGDGTFKCKKCGKKFNISLPNFLTVSIENGQPILRADVGLVLTEDALKDPKKLLSSWISYIDQLYGSKKKYLPDLPEEYHQNWWRNDKKGD